MSDQPKCELCGEPMPAGEEMFKIHGYSGNCPKPPLRRVWVCSNPVCGAEHAQDPQGHCPACKRPDGSGWSCVPTSQPDARRISTSQMAK